MKISMIAAMANNRVIGANNGMPWHLPADLAHFKKVTLGKPVVMGRKTYHSIGRALPGRKNIVISRDANLTLPDAIVVDSCDAALKAASDFAEVMIIGGGNIYQQFLPLCEALYLTEIELDVDGDTQFPDYQKASSWDVVSQESHSADSKNPYSYRFIHLAKTV